MFDPLLRTAFCLRESVDGEGRSPKGDDEKARASRLAAATTGGDDDIMIAVSIMAVREESTHAYCLAIGGRERKIVARTPVNLVARVSDYTIDEIAGMLEHRN